MRAAAAEGQDPLRLLLDGLQAIERGEPAPELPDSWPGLYAEVAKAFNGVAGARRAANQASQQAANGNGKHAWRVRPDTWDGKAAVLLDALLAVKKGDGSAKLPVTWPGISGKIAAGLQRRRRAQRQDADRACAPEPRGRQGRQAQAARKPGRRERLLARERRSRELAHGGPRASLERGCARHRRGRAGRPFQEHGARGRGPAPRRRIPAHGKDHQHHGGAARHLCRRGDARRPRGRLGRQARRPGRGAGRRRHLEGPDRQRQLDGEEPHRSGAQHRRRDDRRCHGRPVQEDHRRRQGRAARAEEHHQHDGGPATLVRRRGDARCPRGRHRRRARRPGRRARRRRHVEGLDRERQLHGRQPHGPGAQHRRGDHRRCPRRPVEKDHRRREGRDPGAQEHHQHHGGSARLVCVRGDARRARGRLGRQARRPGRGAGRRRHLEGPDRQRQLHGRQPHGPGAQHRRRDDRRRQRRPVAQDHRRREGRDPRAEEHHQHDGGSAPLVRGRGDARRARGRHRRRSSAARPTCRASPARGRT